MITFFFVATGVALYCLASTAFAHALSGDFMPWIRFFTLVTALSSIGLLLSIMLS